MRPLLYPLCLCASLLGDRARAADRTLIDDYLPVIWRCDDLGSIKDSDDCVNQAFVLLTAGSRSRLPAARYACWSYRRFDACEEKAARHEEDDAFYLRRHTACESVYELRLLARLLGQESNPKLPLIERSLVPAGYRIDSLEELLDTLATSAVNPCDPGRAPAQ